MMQKEKMLQGELYVPFGDKELAADYKKCKKLLRVFNATTEEEAEKRAEILKSLWGKTGDKPYVEPPFYCDYGCNIYVGDNF
ncbi:MAG: sugar O-acetyltransferase, partial [Alphaproteobacteria bacterium]|nr:sugar O-acetyltransferase [Alphaproteobacteria bacterium]